MGRDGARGGQRLRRGGRAERGLLRTAQPGQVRRQSVYRLGQAGRGCGGGRQRPWEWGGHGGGVNTSERPRAPAGRPQRRARCPAPTRTGFPGPRAPATSTAPSSRSMDRREDRMVEAVWRAGGGGGRRVWRAGEAEPWVGGGRRGASGAACAVAGSRARGSGLFARAARRRKWSGTLNRTDHDHFAPPARPLRPQGPRAPPERDQARPAGRWRAGGGPAARAAAAAHATSPQPAALRARSQLTGGGGAGSGGSSWEGLAGSGSAATRSRGPAHGGRR